MRLKLRARFIAFVAIGLLALLLPSATSATAHSDAHAARITIRVPTLMYHYISAPPADADISLRVLAVSPAHFLQQMQWLKTHGYTSITPDMLSEALLKGTKLPPKSVLLTFDDGYIDAYTNAFPILKQFGFVGTFFIVTDWVDQGRSGYLNWAQIKEMAQAGMSIEAHSRTHENMSGRDKAWLDNEIVGSMNAIETHIGARPRFFAYPAGRYDLNTLKAIRAAGLTAAFSTRSTVSNSTADMLTLPRLRVRGSSTVAEIAGDMQLAN